MGRRGVCTRCSWDDLLELKSRERRQECAHITRDGGVLQNLHGLEWAGSGIGCSQILVRGTRQELLPTPGPTPEDLKLLGLDKAQPM